MNKIICIDQDLLLEAYKYLVLYGLIHEIGETEMFNTFLKNIEQHLPDEDKI